MHFKTLSLVALLCTSALSGVATAQTLLQPTEAPPKPANAPAMTPKPPVVPIFISADFLANPGLILPAAPSPESAEGKAQLAEVKAIQAASSPARIALATADDKNETVTLFADVVPGLDPAKLPATAALFDAVKNDQGFEAKRFKAFFQRLRPFDLDHSIKTCVPSTYGKGASSYPSGHTTLGFAMGVVLANLIPEKSAAILKRSQEYGESRVVCGVHFSADTVASQTLGTLVAVQMLQNPEFKKRFDASKAELIAAGLTK